MLSNFESRKKHQQHLAQLSRIPQISEELKTIFSPKEFRHELIKAIIEAKNHVYMVALYLENDLGGQAVLDAIYLAKETKPKLEIAILVDWHRAQRGRIGENTGGNTNADWYCRMAEDHPSVDIPVYGVPVNTCEALGVLHLKGFIIDNRVIYSGASLNDLYLHQKDKYRYDRYQIIGNTTLANTLLNYIRQYLLATPAVHRLNHVSRPKNIDIKNATKIFRETLRQARYKYESHAEFSALTITPLVGLGKQSPLNKTIHHLICSTKSKLILCTPYFNMPALLVRDIIDLLRHGRQIELIIGDKTANDFYIPENQPFKIIGALPYLYEINLRCFLSRLQRYLDNGQLLIRLWKDGNNGYHLKGIWVDNEWQLLTGNNFNPRSWRLDLENALLIHDPKLMLLEQREYELTVIRTHTEQVYHHASLQEIADYPEKVHKIIRRLRRIRIDRIISHIL